MPTTALNDQIELPLRFMNLNVKKTSSLLFKLSMQNKTIKSNQIKSNQIKSNQIKSDQIKSQGDGTCLYYTEAEMPPI